MAAKLPWCWTIPAPRPPAARWYYLVEAAQGFVNQIYGVANPTTANVISTGSCGTYTIPSYTVNAALGPSSTPAYTWVNTLDSFRQRSVADCSRHDQYDELDRQWLGEHAAR